MEQGKSSFKTCCSVKLVKNWLFRKGSSSSWFFCPQMWTSGVLKTLFYKCLLKLINFYNIRRNFLMLQEKMLDLYTFYRDLNHDRKSDWCAAVLSLVLTVLSQGFTSKGNKILKLIESNLAGGEVYWRLLSFRLPFFFNSVEVIKMCLGCCSTYSFHFVCSIAFKGMFVQLPSRRNYACFVFCEVVFQPTLPLVNLCIQHLAKFW